jgi:hypothetical protein
VRSARCIFLKPASLTRLYSIGVGAQSGSCLKCSECSSEREPYCLNGMVGTYNGIYPSGDKSSGGYADFARLPAHFAIQIPDGLPSAVAAPMLCGGVTVFSPLKQYGAGTERKEVRRCPPSLRPTALTFHSGWYRWNRRPRPLRYHARQGHGRERDRD